METLTQLLNFEVQFIVYLFILVVCGAVTLKTVLTQRILRFGGPTSFRDSLRTTWSRIRSPDYFLPAGISLLLLTITLSLCLFNIHRLLTMKPRVIRTNPPVLSSITDYRMPIEIEFSGPVDLTKLTVNTFPVLTGQWEKKGYFKILPIGRTVTFHPTHSYPIGQKLMVYLSNISRPFMKEFGSEHLLEIYVADPPDITATDPKDSAVSVPTDTRISATLSRANSPSVTWYAELTPESELMVETDETETITIRPNQPLKQDTSYEMRIFRSAGIYDTQRGTLVTQEEKVPVHAIKFRTVKAPLISAFSPTGNDVDPDTPVVISFDQAMQKESVMQSLSISPDATGSMSWNQEASVLTFNPALRKDTSYTVTLRKGLSTAMGGKLEDSVSHTFRTVGPVKIASTTPAANAMSVPVDSTITITFNQEVDHASTERTFSIAPEASGSFSWTGNTLVFKPERPLSYNTRYVVSLGTGVRSVRGIDSQERSELMFTTSSERFELNVPMYRQGTGFTCNIASARMLLAYRGVQKTEDELVRTVGMNGTRGTGNPNLGYVSGYGTYWDPIARMVSTYRPNRLFKDWSLSPLLTEVRNGNPVMIWGQNGWSDPHEISWDLPDGTHIHAINGMHSVVVKGYVGSLTNPESILINDPWRGPWTLETKEFLRRWNFFKVALVVD